MHRLVLLVVACGQATYKVFIRQANADGHVAKVSVAARKGANFAARVRRVRDVV